LDPKWAEGRATTIRASKRPVISTEPISHRRETRKAPQATTNVPNKPIRTFGDNIVRIPARKRRALGECVVPSCTTDRASLQRQPPLRQESRNRVACLALPRAAQSCRLLRMEVARQLESLDDVKDHFVNRLSKLANLRVLSIWQDGESGQTQHVGHRVKARFFGDQKLGRG
jgi:hypothetical protein